jgi:hypothetical protein
LEREADDVQPRRPGYDAAVLLRIPVLADLDRYVDPGVVRPEARAPDDVSDVERLTIVEQRLPRLHTTGTSEDAFDPGGGELLAAVPQERRSAVADVRSHAAAERGVHGEHVGAGKEQHSEEKPASPGLHLRRQLSRVRPAENDVVAGCRGLVGDVGAGVAGSDYENGPVGEVRRVPVVA